MKILLDAIRKIVHSGRCATVPVQLSELASNSRCAPVQLLYGADAWVLRLDSGDHLPVLAELPTEVSVRRLPDYLVFCSAPRGEDETLRVLICELKSGSAGVESALPQVRLGKLLAEYLVRIAAHSLGWESQPNLWFSGLIVSPDFPKNLIAKGKTRPGKTELPGWYDPKSKIRNHMAQPGTDVRLECFW
jgi:hypothetical protein